MDTVTIYAWLDNEIRNGSNEIASAILDAKLQDEDFDCVQLCSGQNKNSTMIGVVMKWFKEEALNTVNKLNLCSLQ